MTTTKSPQSMCVVKVGLCLPRKICAICDATRPRTCPSASMMYHCGCRSAALALYVFIIVRLLQTFQDTQPVPDTAHVVGPLNQGASFLHVVRFLQILLVRDAVVPLGATCQPFCGLVL